MTQTAGHFGSRDLQKAIALPSWVVLELYAAYGEHDGVLRRQLESVQRQDPRVFVRLVEDDLIRPTQPSIEIRRSMHRLMEAIAFMVASSRATTPRQLGHWIHANESLLS